MAIIANAGRLDMIDRPSDGGHDSAAGVTGLALIGCALKKTADMAARATDAGMRPGEQKPGLEMIEKLFELGEPGGRSQEHAGTNHKETCEPGTLKARFG